MNRYFARMTQVALVVLSGVSPLTNAGVAAGSEDVVIGGIRRSTVNLMRDVIDSFHHGSANLRLDQRNWHKKAVRLAEGELQLIVSRGMLTSFEQLIIEWKRPQSHEVESVSLGQARLLALVHPQSPLRKMTRDQLVSIVNGVDRLTGGSGAAVDIYVQENPWVHMLVRERLLGELDKYGEFSHGTPLRDDAQMLRYDQVVAKVKSSRSAIGLVLDCGQDLGVLVTVSLVAKGGDDSVTIATGEERRQPVADEPVVLTMLASEPSTSVRKFFNYAGSGEAIAIAERHGLYTPRLDLQLNGKKRIASMMRGVGDPITCVSIERVASIIIADTAREYAYLKVPIQVKCRQATSELESIDAFLRSENRLIDIMWINGRPTSRSMERFGEQWAITRPTERLLAGRATALIVHASNKLNALTLDQVQSIYAGELSDWSVIGGTGLTARGGGESVRIHPLGIGVGDPSAQLFSEQCLKGEATASTVEIKKDTAEAVAAVSVDPQAIAFVDWASIPEAGQTVKVLAIMVGQGERAKPIEPSAETIKNAMYPLSQRIYMYVHPQASDAAKRFAEFLATGGESAMSPYHDSVQAVMDTFRKHGLVSLSEAATKRRIESQLKAAQAEHDRKTKGK